MTTTLTPDLADAARFLAGYAKHYGAGAFATPPAKELASGGWTVNEWADDGHRTVIASKRLARDSIRRDFTGRPFTLGAGQLVATHLARTAGAPIPPLGAYDTVFAYPEDREVTDALARQGRTRMAVQVTAAAQIVAAWGKVGERRYSPADLTTVARLPVEVPDRGAMAAEVEAISTWHDDFPYYSDGSWSAVSLRGFRRDDPTWGIKPAEMPKKWQAQHAESLGWECQWTVLADRTPALVAWVESVPWWAGLERVRLLRMEGARQGHLARHSDVTDRAAGTRDGQIARFHLPIITDPRVTMHNWDLDGRRISTHLPPWTLWYLDTRKPHAVDNPSDVNRVHLVVDVVVDKGVREALGG
jgi:hypothetical protein